MSSRPQQKIFPSAKLNSDNAGELEPTSHRSAVAVSTAPPPLPQLTSMPAIISHVIPKSSPPLPMDTDDEAPPVTDSESHCSSKRTSTGTVKSSLSHDSIISISTTSLDADLEELAWPPITKKAKKSAPSGDQGEPSEVSVIDIDDIEDPDDEPLNKSKKNADILFFFRDAPSLPGQPNGCMKCHYCAEGLGCPKIEKFITNQHSTLRRHLASFHSGHYRKWCEKSNFQLMLPEDSKQRRGAVTDKTQQSSLGDHFTPTRSEHTTLYSDQALEAAAIEWLIQTNQPIHAFKNPGFKKMLDIASRATRGVTLLVPKKTCARIICMFKEQMFLLKKRLNGSTVSGQISLTCDAWQAENTDSVTRRRLMLLDLSRWF